MADLWSRPLQPRVACASSVVGRGLRRVRAFGSAQDCLVSAVVRRRGFLVVVVVVVVLGLDAHLASGLASLASLRKIGLMRKARCRWVVERCFG